MFKDLKKGFQVYLLEKGEVPEYFIGNIVNVSEPRFQNAQPGLSYTQMQERVMDLTIEYKGQTSTYVVKENENVAMPNVLTISCNQDAITNEVNALARNSKEILDSVERHEKTITACDEIIKKLNPTYAKSKEQDEKIENLAKEMSEIKKRIPSLDDIAKLLERSQQNQSKNTK